MAEGNILFLPVKDFCSRSVATCSPKESVLEVAGMMRDKNISSAVVCEKGNPLGILTDRDLRNKVVAQGRDPNCLTAADIMHAPLITVGEDDFIFEALHKISRNNIHRVCVVDAEQRLVGIITDSDILRLQTNSPQRLVRDIEEATTIAEVKSLHKEIQRLVLHLVGTGVSTRELVRMIAHLNDQLLLRLIALLRERQFNDLPDRFAFVVLGSEGRREQTLTTDQDNAILYADNLTPGEISQIKDFSEALIDALIQVGVPPCPGGIMAKNSFWRRSFSAWNEVLMSWLKNPTPENILNGSMFFDIRTLYGDVHLEQELKQRLSEFFSSDQMFLTRLAGNLLRFKPPIGLFGQFKTSRDKAHRGQIDVKKAGIFAITEGVKALAMESGIMSGGTRERMKSLFKKGVLDQVMGDDLEASYNFLVFMRLRCQVEGIQAGREPDNYITLARLNHMEKGRLKVAFEEVRKFQDFLEVHFRLHLLR
jgi:CBS domain-containing protein